MLMLFTSTLPPRLGGGGSKNNTGETDPKHDITSGRLHNDTAYGSTGLANAKGVPIVVHRKPLIGLKPDEIMDAAAIPDKDLQAALWRVCEGLAGKVLEDALRAFSKAPGPFEGIRRVRAREALNVIPLRDKEGRAYKGYKGDANARYDVWRMPDGKWVADIVSMFDAHARHVEPKRPHPAAKKVLSLRQNDLVAYQPEGEERKVMRVVKFSTNGSMQLAAHHEAGALKARDADPSDPFKYTNTSAGGLKKAQARQVRIDPLGKVLDPGPR
jgi:CRISPR-associated endonuclease Csn1